MIRYHCQTGCAQITLQRPDKANSLTQDMLTALIANITRAKDAGCQALILTGTGRVFSAGADLDEARAGLAQSPLWEELSCAIATYPGLSIAALNGTVAGGAMGMVLATDLRIAVPHATFFYPVAKLGFLPQPSDPGRLAALIGPSKAKLMLLAGQKLSCDEALAAGLVDRRVETPSLLTNAQELAELSLKAEKNYLEQLLRLCRI